MICFFSFILGAVSPAVVVPSMLNLQMAGYGTKEGIPTLVMAASSCDDVLAISLFSVFLGIAFSQGSYFHPFVFKSVLHSNYSSKGYILFKGNERFCAVL